MRSHPIVAKDDLYERRNRQLDVLADRFAVVLGDLERGVAVDQHGMHYYEYAQTAHIPRCGWIIMSLYDKSQ